MKKIIPIAEALRARVIIRNGALLAFVIYASESLGLPEGLYMALAMLTVMELNLGGGILAGRERLVGTILGLLAVVIGAGALSEAPAPLRVGISLILVRIFCFYFGLNSGYIVGGHVVSGSILNHNSDWWFYASWRTVMTLAGVVLGIWCSTQIYSQLATTEWEQKARIWIGDIANCLSKLNNFKGSIELFISLRNRRNLLQQEIPKLVCEQSVLDQDFNNLFWAQNCLRCGSTVISCCRDLSPLFGEHLQKPLSLKLPINNLIFWGSAKLKVLAKSVESNDDEIDLISRELSLIRADLMRISQCYFDAVEISANSALVLEQDPNSNLFVLSRLLLLVDSLIEISPLRSMPSKALI